MYKVNNRCGVSRVAFRPNLFGTARCEAKKLRTWTSSARLACAEEIFASCARPPQIATRQPRMGTRHERRAGEGIQVPGLEGGRGNGWDRRPSTCAAQGCVSLLGTRHWLEASSFSAVSFAELEQRIVVGLRCVSLDARDVLYDVARIMSVPRTPSRGMAAWQTHGDAEDEWPAANNRPWREFLAQPARLGH